MKRSIDDYIFYEGSGPGFKKTKETASDELLELAWETCQCFIRLLPKKLSLLGEVIKITFIETETTGPDGYHMVNSINMQAQIVFRLNLEPTLELALRWNEQRNIVHVGRIRGNLIFEPESDLTIIPSELKEIKGENESEIRAKILMLGVKKKIKRYISSLQSSLQGKIDVLKELEGLTASV